MKPEDNGNGSEELVERYEELDVEEREFAQHDRWPRAAAIAAMVAVAVCTWTGIALLVRSCWGGPD